MTAVTRDHADRTFDKERIHQLRSSLNQKTALEVSRELSGLVDCIRTLSQKKSTVRFIIGVSFSRNNTLLDYRIRRVLTPNAQDGNQIEPVKDPVSHDQPYLSFVYPSDPEFSHEGLRSILLTLLEQELTDRPQRDQDIDRREGSSTSPSPCGKLVRTIKYLF